ncbi:MAG: tyrosine--tRNA ligase [Deltaproteobacteria bacterium]|nr:tyrosine--tRNA ligase [Deltaproteobacteria bacterium]
MRDVEEQLALLLRGVTHVESENELRMRLKEGKRLVVKAGFDPTSADLHLGHTVLMSKMRTFQELGHKVVFVVGDFTAMIGDPTGKSATRPRLTREQVLEHAETYTRQAFKVLDREATEVRYNSEWLGPMTAADTVTLAAKYTVARMLERDDFTKRFQAQKPISVHELLYPLFQGYDSVALQCDIELGGSDQLFNLLVGRALMKDYGLRPQMVMTTPLLEGTDARVENGKLVGDKMSKSLGNYVGVDEAPNDVYGKLMRVTDEAMWRYYELLSRVDNEALAALKGGHPMVAKKALARELTTRFHGDEAATAAQAHFEQQHQRGEVPDDIESVSVVVDDGATGLALIKVLVAAGLAKSGGDAKRLVGQKAVAVDGEVVTDGQRALARGGVHVVRCGRQYRKVTLA